MANFVTPGLTPEPMQTIHMLGRQRRHALVSIPERDGVLNHVRKGRETYQTTLTQSFGSWDGIKHTRKPFRFKSIPGRVPNVLLSTGTIPLTQRPINVSNIYENRSV